MALGSTQPLTEMSTRIFPGGKGGRCVRLTTLPPSYAVVTKSGNRNFLEPSGPPRACNGTALPLPFAFVTILHTSCKVPARCPQEQCFIFLDFKFPQLYIFLEFIICFLVLTIKVYLFFMFHSFSLRIFSGIKTFVSHQ